MFPKDPLIPQNGTLPETKSSHLKMDGWKPGFFLGKSTFRGYVRFREGNHPGDEKASARIHIEIHLHFLKLTPGT